MRWEDTKEAETPKTFEYHQNKHVSSSISKIFCLYESKRCCRRRNNKPLLDPLLYVLKQENIQA